MKFEKIDSGNRIVAVVSSENKVITDVNPALDLLMSAKYGAGTKYIVVDKKLVIEDFFVLSNGLAGEILQKYINYGGKIAIYGDYSHYTSKPLKDFIYESNKGRDVFFVVTKEEAIQKKEYFNQIIDWEFDGLKVKIPAKYDAFLTNMYGDYMTLPLEEERTGKHNMKVYWKE